MKLFFSLDVKNGNFALLPLGQHSFLMKTARHLIAFDPYLTADKERLVAPPIGPEELADCDLILGSHDHGDHIDRPSLPAMACSASRATMVVPEAVRATIPFPAERLRGMNDGGVLECDGIRITAIASAHELLNRDEATGLYPCLGYVVEADGVTAYHSGDCCIYEGLQTKLSRWKFDVMMLPINGRDAKRLKNDCIGNMTYQEAVDLAGALRPKLVVPAHFDMFAMNLGDPKLFQEYLEVKYPGIACAIPVPGKSICL